MPPCGVPLKLPQNFVANFFSTLLVHVHSTHWPNTPGQSAGQDNSNSSGVSDGQSGPAEERKYPAREHKDVERWDQIQTWETDNGHKHTQCAKWLITNKQVTNKTFFVCFKKP